MESQELKIGANNRPYKSEKSAMNAMQQMGLDFNEYEVIPHKVSSMGSIYEGFAIRKKKNPVNVEAVPDQGVGVLQVSEPIEPEQTNATNQTKPNQPEKGEERKFFRVRFHGKQNPNDFNDVTLGVNGEVLVIRREKEVIIPEAFLIAAENAQYPQISQEPGKPRKTVAHVTRYPREVLGEATEEEYIAQRVSGTKLTKKVVQKYGFDYQPDEGEEF